MKKYPAILEPVVLTRAQNGKGRLVPVMEEAGREPRNMFIYCWANLGKPLMSV